MKKDYIRKKIIISCSILGGLIALSAASIYYKIHQEQKSRETINKIKEEVSSLEEKRESLEGKILKIKKYKKVYKEISEKRKSTVGIKIDDINSKLKKISEKYNIQDTKITVSFPENMKRGIFQTKSVTMVSSSVDLNFNAVSDIEAILFMYEFTDSLPGYVVIKNSIIRKQKEYTNKDLISISSGVGQGSVVGQMNFRWYVYRDKERKTVKKTRNNSIF